MADNLCTTEDYFDLPLCFRLAFREFGTCLGIHCLAAHDRNFEALVEKTVYAWESVGVVPEPAADATIPDNLVPITCVMYSAALFPGGN